MSSVPFPACLMVFPRRNARCRRSLRPIRLDEVARAGDAEPQREQNGEGAERLKEARFAGGQARRHGGFHAATVSVSARLLACPRTLGSPAPAPASRTASRWPPRSRTSPKRPAAACPARLVQANRLAVVRVRRDRRSTTRARPFALSSAGAPRGSSPRGHPERAFISGRLLLVLRAQHGTSERRERLSGRRLRRLRRRRGDVLLATAVSHASLLFSPSKALSPMASSMASSFMGTASTTMYGFACLTRST